MKRLTERDKNGTAMAACCGENCKHNFCCENGGFAECGDMDDIIDRLAAYEDTGLEPEEIEKAMDIVKSAVSAFEDFGVDRLAELAQADREGRCVVAPLKVGWTVYLASNTFGVEEETVERNIAVSETWSASVRAKDIGKTVFLTRQKAEEALRREQE